MLARSRAIAFGLILVAFGLWLASLTQRSIWADELGTIDVLRRRDLPSLLSFVADAERRPPLYFVLLWLWTFVAGAHEFVLRYFSLWFATLCVPLTLALGRSMRRLIAHTPPSWLVVLLLVFSPVLALYSVMIRYYAFVLCLALMLMLFFVRWILAAPQVRSPAASSLTLFSTMVIASMVQRYEVQDRLRARRLRLLLQGAWFLAALCLLYSDYSVLALLGAQVLWLWSWRRTLREWIFALLGLGLAFLPLLASLLSQVGREKQVADFSGSAAGVALEIVYPIYSFIFGETFLPWHVAFIAAAPFVAFALLRALWVLRRPGAARMAVWHVVLPVAFNVFILSAIATDLAFLTIASRTLFVLPLFLIWLACGILQLPERWRTPAVALLLLANLAALANLFEGLAYHNPIYAVPVREVAESIRHDSRPGDVVVSDLDTAFYYYWDQQPPEGVRHFLTSESELPQAEAALAGAVPGRVWLLVFGRDRSRENDHTAELEGLLAGHYALASERDYAPVDDLYRALKSKLLGRGAYAYKLVVRVYERNR